MGRLRKVGGARREPVSQTLCGPGGSGGTTEPDGPASDFEDELARSLAALLALPEDSRALPAADDLAAPAAHEPEPPAADDFWAPLPQDRGQVDVVQGPDALPRQLPAATGSPATAAPSIDPATPAPDVPGGDAGAEPARDEAGGDDAVGVDYIATAMAEPPGDALAPAAPDDLPWPRADDLAFVPNVPLAGTDRRRAGRRAAVLGVVVAAVAVIGALVASWGRPSTHDPGLARSAAPSVRTGPDLADHAALPTIPSADVAQVPAAGGAAPPDGTAGVQPARANPDPGGRSAGAPTGGGSVTPSAGTGTPQPTLPGPSPGTDVPTSPVAPAVPTSSSALPPPPATTVPPPATVTTTPPGSTVPNVIHLVGRCLLPLLQLEPVPCQ